MSADCIIYVFFLHLDILELLSVRNNFICVCSLVSFSPPRMLKVAYNKDIRQRHISVAHEPELALVINSDPSHCSALLAARGELWAALQAFFFFFERQASVQQYKTSQGFPELWQHPNKVHSQHNIAGWTEFALMGSSLINAGVGGGDCVSWQSRSLKCFNINEPIKHLDDIRSPPRLLCCNFHSEVLTLITSP